MPDADASIISNQGVTYSAEAPPECIEMLDRSRTARSNVPSTKISAEKKSPSWISPATPPAARFSRDRRTPGGSLSPVPSTAAPITARTREKPPGRTTAHLENACTTGDRRGSSNARARQRSYTKSGSRQHRELDAARVVVVLAEVFRRASVGPSTRRRVQTASLRLTSEPRCHA